MNPSLSASFLSSNILCSFEAGGKTAGRGMSFGAQLLTVGLLNTAPAFSEPLVFSKPDNITEEVRFWMSVESTPFESTPFSLTRLADKFETLAPISGYAFQFFVFSLK